jgi:hypothetical protein
MRDNGRPIIVSFSSGLFRNGSLTPIRTGIRELSEFKVYESSDGTSFESPKPVDRSVQLI